MGDQSNMTQSHKITNDLEISGSSQPDSSFPTQTVPPHTTPTTPALSVPTVTPQTAQRDLTLDDFLKSTYPQKYKKSVGQ